jgi:hypothetical protein
VEIGVLPADDRSCLPSALDEIPYDVLAESIAGDEVWNAVFVRLRSLLTAVASGRTGKNGS